MSRFFFFFKQKTAYELRISDWSSDVCSSDLPPMPHANPDTCFQRLILRLQDFWARQGCVILQSGRAPCRERECQDVYISVVAVYLKNKEIYHYKLDDSLCYLSIFIYQQKHKHISVMFSIIADRKKLIN